MSFGNIKSRESVTVKVLDFNSQSSLLPYSDFVKDSSELDMEPHRCTRESSCLQNKVKHSCTPTGVHVKKKNYLKKKF